MGRFLKCLKYFLDLLTMIHAEQKNKEAIASLF